MKHLDKIPTTKLSRATKLFSTGAKLGMNYVKYQSDKIFDGKDIATENLHKNNASDIYDSLKNLKGSALKVAQMLSMEKNILPNAYVEQFSLAQFQVPPLSAPLVRKTFKTNFGKYPEDIFTNFNPNATKAASIGQVHKAEYQGKQVAIKIQYPGIAESISSDLAIVKPLAMRMLNLKGKSSDQYFQEVEKKLMEETDYAMELHQSLEIREACKNLKNLRFPFYYQEISNRKILSMTWENGVQISEFAAANTDMDLKNQIGQALWDFYVFQLHELRKVHADPHPGNFLVDMDSKELIALDFGCMKDIPEEFYVPYFELLKKENIVNEKIFDEKLLTLEVIRPEDSEAEKIFLQDLFRKLLSIFTRPFHQEYFDFSDESFFEEISNIGLEYSNATELKKMDAGRGSKHFIYINRTFLGLYNLMHIIGGNKIKIKNLDIKMPD